MNKEELNNFFDTLLNRKLFYKLEGKIPVNCGYIEYHEDRINNDWVLKKSKPIPDVEVSTVFLGINTNAFSKEPVCFETMIFGGKYDHYTIRKAKYDDAIAEHDEWCLKLINEQ